MSVDGFLPANAEAEVLEPVSPASVEATVLEQAKLPKPAEHRANGNADKPVAGKKAVGSHE